MDLKQILAHIDNISFENAMFGYDKDQVDAELHEISEEVRSLETENNKKLALFWQAFMMMIQELDAPESSIRKMLGHLLEQGMISQKEHELILKECISVKIDIDVRPEIINCIACHKEYKSYDRNFCPHCHYPVLTLRANRLQEKREVEIYRWKNGIHIEKLIPKPGELYEMGVYGGEKIQWRILEVGNGKALLLSENGLDAKAYRGSYDDVTWEESDIRKWLNQEFIYQAFKSTEIEKIDITEVRNDFNTMYGTPGGNNTWDQLFLLSYVETKKYLPSNMARICYPTNYAKSQGVNVDPVNGCCWWWLRSPGNKRNYAELVLEDGDIDAIGDYVVNRAVAVRPAMWIRF